MKPKKQKRIRAHKVWRWYDIDPRITFFHASMNVCKGWRGQKPYYVLAADNVPALIEQLVRDYMHAPSLGNINSMAHALKRAGITPPKGGAR